MRGVVIDLSKYAKGGMIDYSKKGFDKLLRESRETDDLPMVEAFVDGEWITVASDDIQGVHTFDGKDYHLFTNDFDGKDIVEKGKDYPFTFSSKSAEKKAFKHRITKMKKVGSTYAKGGEVKKKENNEMIIGGLAGILLGIFLNK